MSLLKLSMSGLGTISIESLIIYYVNVIVSTFYTSYSDNGHKMSYHNYNSTTGTLIMPNGL